MSPATSNSKIEANRQNAALSTGPTTAEGKLASSRNAISHGLTSAQALLPNEDPAVYAALLDMYRMRYRPADPLSHQLVEELAGLNWRLRRVPVVEAHLISREMAAVAREPEHAALESHIVLAIAFERLVQRKVLTNLSNQEARLNNRAVQIQKLLSTIERIQTRPAPIPGLVLRPQQPQQQQQSQPIQKYEPIRLPQPGRNEICPCGSGLKFKRCCLNRPAAKAAAA